MRLRVLILQNAFNELAPVVKHGGDVGAQLHQDGRELDESLQLANHDWLFADGEELGQLVADFEREFVLLLHLLL